MTITFPMSPDISAMQKTLQQNNDLYGGRDAIYNNRKVYIAQLEGQEDESYNNMVARAVITPFYPAVVEQFVGSTFAKEPLKTLPDFDGFKNIDLLGNSIDQYSSDFVRDVLKQGFSETIIDYSIISKTPFFRYISPESFVSYRIETVNDRPQITRLIYKNIEEREDSYNEFETSYIDAYTVLDISDGAYRIRNYENQSLRDEKTQQIHEEIVKVGTDVYPTKNGKTLTEIPMKLHGVNANNFSIERSRLQDVSDLNISLIQRVVDQVHMLHYTALPTPWVAGIDSDDSDCPTSIGPQEIWILSNPEAKVGLLEFSGASAKAHEEFVQKLKNTMAEIGAQLLSDKGVSRETAVSALIRNNSQTITVSSIVNNISAQLVDLLKFYADWAGLNSSEIDYQLNSDFVRAMLDANTQISLVKSWKDGAISKVSLHEKFKEGEIVNASRTFEEEEALIKANPSPEMEAALAKTEAEIEAIKKGTNEIGNPDSTGKGQNQNEYSGSPMETGTITGDKLLNKQIG